MSAVDFFVSYAGRDRDWAVGLDQCLKQAGYSTIIQAIDFVPGTNFAASMHQALLAADRLLLVLSPEYLQSPFTTAEWTAAFLADPVGQQRKLIGVRIREFERAGLLAPFVYIDLVGLEPHAINGKFLAGIKAAVSGTGLAGYRYVEPKAPRKPKAPRINQKVQGDGNFTAGGDIKIGVVEKIVRPFAPDERHITTAQARKIKKMIEDLAQRAPDNEGKPTYDRWWGLLYRTYEINTYRELPREKFTEAVSLLKQQKAINRPKLRRRNPQLWKNDHYAVIWAAARALGWDKPQVYAFAFEQIPLAKPITSLKQLGPIQLKRLADLLRGKSP